MALRNWKKGQLGWKDDVRFNKGKSFEDMPKEQLMIEELLGGKWRVSKRTFAMNGFIKTYRTLKSGFKTKTKALNFAKAYMRTH